MAIGRRKRFFGAVLTVGGGTLYTAGSAPADGSAAASMRLVLTNNNVSAVNFSVQVASNLAWLGSIPANGTLLMGETVDLMGGETIVASAAVAAVCTLTGFGVEAKDS